MGYGMELNPQSSFVRDDQPENRVVVIRVTWDDLDKLPDVTRAAILEARWYLFINRALFILLLIGMVGKLANFGYEECTRYRLRRLEQEQFDAELQAQEVFKRRCSG